MKRISVFIFFIFAFCLFHGQVFSQTLTEYNTLAGQVMSKGIDGISNIAASIIADSFTPMTHYKKGDFVVTGVPAWFDVKKAYDSPDIKGKDFTGIAGGIGAGYALTDDFMLYGIAAFIKMNGDLYGDYYGSYSPPLKADTDYSLFSFFAGAGYDIFSGSWSMPVFAGLSVQHYNAKINLPGQSITVPIAGTLETEFSGSGLLAGATAGIALSKTFLDSIRITPYFLYMLSFNKPELNNKTTITSGSSLSHESKTKGEQVSAGMLGLCLTLLSEKNYSVSVSLGGLITSSSGYYNKKFLNGLEMKSAVAALTWQTNFEKAE